VKGNTIRRNDAKNSNGKNELMFSMPAVFRRICECRSQVLTLVVVASRRIFDQFPATGQNRLFLQHFALARESGFSAMMVTFSIDSYAGQFRKLFSLNQGNSSMNMHEIRVAASALTRLHQRFAPLFGRKEAQAQSLVYLNGLLLSRDGKSAEPTALVFGEADDYRACGEDELRSDAVSGAW
jgi:hypothetical protein